MKEIVIQPEDVRSGGNILNSRDSGDFDLYRCDITSSSDSGSPTGESFTIELNEGNVQFKIDNYGHLIMTVGESCTESFTINSNGHLVVTGTNEANYNIINNHCYYGVI